jgi:hypothetical protein
VPSSYEQSLSERARSLSIYVPPEVADLLVEMAERVDQATAAEAVIARATGRPAPPPPPVARDRHGLHAVHGSAAAALVWTAARTHKAIAAAAVGVLSTAVVLAPSVVTHQPASAAHQPPGRPVAAPALRDPRAVPLAAGPVRRHRKHHRDGEDGTGQLPAPTPSATPGMPTPMPTVPSPTPTPAVTSPAPTPTPSASATASAQAGG